MWRRSKIGGLVAGPWDGRPRGDRLDGGSGDHVRRGEKLLWTTVVQYVDGRVPVIAGTGSNSTAGSIEMTKLAESCGVDGVLIVGPYYNKPTQEGYYRHFKAIADSTSCKVILYNVPGRTAANVAPATVARTAAACPNVVAIKEAAGRVDQVAELYRLLPEDFTITAAMMASSCRSCPSARRA